jgi:hemerythrin-like domain-containing protein
MFLLLVIDRARSRARAAIVDAGSPAPRSPYCVVRAVQGRRHRESADSHAPEPLRSCIVDGTMKPTDVLSSEHRVIEQVLDCLERIARQAVASGHLDRTSGGRALEVLVTFADRCHHGKEEGALFPALERLGLRRGLGPIAVMLAEHDIGRSALDRMRGALAEGSPNAFADAANHYVELMREHIAKEDGVLFPLAESLLGDEHRDEILRAVELTEARELGAETRTRILAIADDLADRYGVEKASTRTRSAATGHACCDLVSRRVE